MTDAKIYVIQGSESYFIARVPAFPGCNATGRTRATGSPRKIVSPAIDPRITVSGNDI